MQKSGFFSIAGLFALTIITAVNAAYGATIVQRWEDSSYFLNVTRPYALNDSVYMITDSVEGGYWWGYDETLMEYDSPTRQCSGYSTNVDENWCSLEGYCIYMYDTHIDSPSCADMCTSKGYDMVVYHQWVKDNKQYVRFACACSLQQSYETWQECGDGKLCLYEVWSDGDGKTGRTTCTQTVKRVDFSKCIPTKYYGTPETGCKKCPDNAKCPARSCNPNRDICDGIGDNAKYASTYFVCNSGYYTNSTGDGCTKCPDSKEGGIGWDSNGNGVPAVGGDELEWCAISSGTVLKDDRGTFILDPNNSLSDGCEYSM